MEHSGANAILLTVLTGFLGAEKTTLLNRILNGDHGPRIAVLVNNFGSINIDAELVVGIESDMISLANGCAFCSIRSDLLDAVIGVLGRPERPEYALLEARGVADPTSIVVTFNDEALRDRIRFDSITCVIDADQVFAYQDQPFVGRLKILQIACADITIFDEIDRAGPEQVAKAHAWLGDDFERLRVFETSHCDVRLELLLGGGCSGRGELTDNPPVLFAITRAAPAIRSCIRTTTSPSSPPGVSRRLSPCHLRNSGTWSGMISRPRCFAVRVSSFPPRRRQSGGYCKPWDGERTYPSAMPGATWFRARVPSLSAHQAHSAQPSSTLCSSAV